MGYKIWWICCYLARLSTPPLIDQYCICSLRSLWPISPTSWSMIPIHYCIKVQILLKYQMMVQQKKKSKCFIIFNLSVFSTAPVIIPLACLEHFLTYFQSQYFLLDLFRHITLALPSWRPLDLRLHRILLLSWEGCGLRQLFVFFWRKVCTAFDVQFFSMHTPLTLGTGSVINSIIDLPASIYPLWSWNWLRPLLFNLPQ